MNVVLSGYYGFHNAGDEAILKAIIASLRKEDAAIGITVLSNDPEETAKTHGVAAVNRWNLREVRAAIRDADGLISGGGSLLQDKTGGRSVLYYAGVMFLAKQLKKPYFIYAQGIGPLDKKMSRFIVKRGLSKAAQITVRDEESRQLLKEIGIKKEIEIVFDPVLGLKPQTLKLEWLQKQQYKEPIIAVSVRDWPSDFDFQQQLALALDQLVQAGNRIVFLPMHGKHDEEASICVIDKMKETAEIAPFTLSIEEKIAFLIECKLLIGMRLHALIFAALAETPFVALSYDPKIDSFAKLCEQPVAANVNNDWSAKELMTVTETHLKNHEKEVEHLRAFINEAKRRAELTAQKAIQSFHQARG